MSGARRYELLAELGSGGFGTVYRARFVGEAGFEKIVALKMLSPGRSASEEFVSRLRDEARVLGLLTHDAIVGVYHLTLLGGRWTIVMEYVEGVDLSRLIRGGPMHASIALEITHRIAGALEYAWRQRGPSGAPLRLLHRDLKPPNVRITHLGAVKVLDFGIAKAEFDARESVTKYRFGTPEYMAPERWTPADEVPAGDIYSLGVVLYEMLCGEVLGVATRNRGMHSLLMTEIERRLAEVADLPAAAKELVLSMLAFEPTERPDARTVHDKAYALVRSLGATSMRSWAEDIIAPMLERQAQERELSDGPPLATFEDEQFPGPLPPFGPDTLRSEADLGPGVTPSGDAAVGTLIGGSPRSPDAAQADAGQNPSGAAAIVQSGVALEVKHVGGTGGEEARGEPPVDVEAVGLQGRPPQTKLRADHVRTFVGALLLAIAVVLVWATQPGIGSPPTTEPSLPPPPAGPGPEGVSTVESAPAPGEGETPPGAEPPAVEIPPSSPDGSGAPPLPKGVPEPGSPRSPDQSAGKIPGPATPSPPPPAPPEPTQVAPAQPPAGSVKLRLIGSGTVALVGSDQKEHAVDFLEGNGELKLPIGRYRVLAAFGQESVKEHRTDVNIAEAGVVEIRCDAEFGTCKLEQR